jgi:ABC-type sugar transport system, periplasmic component
VVDAGIPVVMVNTDVPESKRLAFVGADFTESGRVQARGLYAKIGDIAGTVAEFGSQTSAYSNLQKQGFESEMAKLNPKIKCMGIYETNGDTSKVVKTATDLINSTPDLVGFAGYDPNGGAGCATAIKETGKQGKIWGTGSDMELEELRGVKDGYLAVTVGQNNRIQTYYAIKLLYDYNHTKIKWTDNDKAAGILDIPKITYVPNFSVTSENVDAFIAAKEKEGTK